MTSYSSPSTSTLALNQFMDVKMVPMPREIDVPDTVSPDDNLSTNVASQIKQYSGGRSIKTYYENLFMMRVALQLCESTTTSNIVYAKNRKGVYRIFGVVCENGYILIPRCEVALFKLLRSWKFCSPSMKPDVVIFYHSVSHLFPINDSTFQKQAFTLLKDVRSWGVPLLYIEEQSSTIMQTALCCAFRLVEHHRLLRSIGIVTGELFGFAFPRHTEPKDTNASVATDVYDAQVDDDDDQRTEETEADTSIIEDLENTSQQPRKKKARLATAPIKVSVKWVIEKMHFRTTYEALQYNEAWTALNDVVQSAKNMLVQNLKSSPDVNSSFLFKLTEQELQQVITANLVTPTPLNKQLQQCKSLGWLKTNDLEIVQLPSAPSFVFQLASKSKQDKSCIVKYFVHSMSELKFNDANAVLRTLDATEIQRFCVPIVRVQSLGQFYIFEQLLPPLANLDAKPCMQYICTEVRESLKLMHYSLNLAHLDVRLPNICYRRLTPSSYIPVLIDYERVDKALDCSAHLYVSSDLYPQLQNMYIDYVQLFAMASSTKEFISSFVMAALESDLSPETLDETFTTFIDDLPQDTKTISEIFNSRE